MQNQRLKPKYYDVDYKILILGESRVGKSSIIKRLDSGKFTENTISTVGLDFVNAYFTIDGLIVRLQIWDTAGQERFRTITRSHFRNSKGIILAYDITSKESFEKLEYWVQSLTTMRLQSEVIYLVGNKKDLDSEREVSYEQSLKFSRRNLFKFFETSAKTGENLSEIFSSLAFDILDLNDMHKMERYKHRSIADSYVYSYDLPKEIYIKDQKKPLSKRKFILPFRKKLKYKAPVAKSLEQLNTISFNPTHESVNIKLKPEKKSSKKKSKKSKAFRSLNCCRIS